MGSKYPHVALTGIVRFRGGHVGSSVHNWLDSSDSENDDDVTEVTDGETTHERKRSTNRKVRRKNTQTLFVVDGRMTRKENTQQSIEEEKPSEQRLSDLTSKCDPYLCYRQLHLRSNMYSWIMVICSVFYIMPALQLMLGAQYVSQHCLLYTSDAADE